MGIEMMDIEFHNNILFDQSQITATNLAQELMTYGVRGTPAAQADTKQKQGKGTSLMTFLFY